jgi:hypothetical protein
MPTDLADIVLFVIPGFVFVQTYRALNPRPRTSHVEQTLWALTFGIGITLLTQAFVGPTAFESDGRAPARLGAFGLLVGLAAALAILRHLVRVALTRAGRRWGRWRWLAPSEPSVWRRLLRDSEGEWVLVELDTGRRYAGWIAEYRFDPDKEHQDLLLEDARRLDDDGNAALEIPGTGVYLSTQRIVAIEFHGP